MIKVILKENTITISGHALYDDIGKDIVCAAVSATVLTTVNAILSIDNTSIKVDEKGFIITKLKDIDVVNKLLNNMVNMLKELEKDYKNNIKIIKEE